MEIDKRQLFGEDVINYDIYRPLYNEKMYEDIFNFIGTKTNYENMNAIEIGCGTGQATTPFLKKGINVCAIEISKNMVDYVEDKFKEYKGFSTSNIEFEKSEITDNSVDLLYSATAFHWINELAYQKVFDIIKPNGVIALFWNFPFVSKPEDKIHMKIQDVYDEYGEKGYRAKSERPKEEDVDKYSLIVEKLIKYGFEDFSMSKYHSVRELSAKDYICLLNTYSDHRLMELKHKKAFEKEIEDIINDNGGIIKIYDTTVLYLSRK